MSMDKMKNKIEEVEEVNIEETEFTEAEENEVEGTGAEAERTKVEEAEIEESESEAEKIVVEETISIPGYTIAHLNCTAEDLNRVIQEVGGLSVSVSSLQKAGNVRLVTEHEKALQN